MLHSSLVVKRFAFVIALIVSMAIPSVTLAVVTEGAVNLPSGQSQSASPGQPQIIARGKNQAYQPGQLILKFSDEAIIGAVAGELLHGQQPFREITGNDHLDHLNARHKVKAMRKVFGKEATPGTVIDRIDRQTATALHRQQRDRFKADASAIREKRLKKKGQKDTKGIMGNNLPYLGSVYNVEIDPAVDIEQACREYAKDPEVAYCQPNYRMEAQWVPNDPYYSSFSSWGQGYDDLWGLKKLQTDAAWDVTRGEGVVVAVVDTGVDYNHADLAANIWTNTKEIPGNGIDDDGNGFIDDVRGWNFYSGSNDPMDDHGHGTHCSGTIAAVGDNSVGIIGVAPSAKIMPLKALGDEGSGTTADLADAIRYAADNGADVISNSWGCGMPCSYNPVAEEAVAYAHTLGAVVVFAAGNSANDVTLYSPQNQSNSVITVASSTELDTRSSFSNIGSLIHVAAPGGGADGASSNRIGRNILSLRAGTTDLYADGLCTVGTNYYRARGTSMAAPHVSGVAALVLAAHPAFTPDDVSQAIRASADDIEFPGFDLLSGAGRVNAHKAVAISSAPKVRITFPLKPVNVTKTKTITITGDAYGANFVKYQLFYAPLNKASGAGSYTPIVGAWQPLGPESSQSVTGGPLATLSSGLFPPGRSYLVKLEVTTSDMNRFSDVKEMAFFSEDPRYYILTSAELDSSRGPQSEGDRFAWLEKEGEPKRSVGKVYDGATNRTFTIYPEADKVGAWVDKIFLNANKVVWYETNYSYSVTGIASITPSGEFIVERKLPYGLFSADQNKLLLNQGRAAYFGTLVYLFDLTTNTLSQEYPLPLGDYSQAWPSLQGSSVVTEMWYPGGVNNDMTVNLTELSTGMNEVVKVFPNGGIGIKVRGALNGPGVVLWNEKYPLMFFDKTTREIKTVTEDSHPDSFATDGKSILYSAMGNETGVAKLNLYSYDIQSGVKELLTSTNFEGVSNNMWPSFGTKHLQWWAAPMILVSNGIPALGAVPHQIIPINATFTLPITATDPDEDKVDLAAVGGTWPEATTALPDGAFFTDNGNGTGSLQWTPSAPGIFTVSFLARDFSGRKDGTWNTVQTATYLAHDPNAPTKPLGIIVSGSGTVNSSPGPDIDCRTASCSQLYTSGTSVTLTASPAADFTFSGWSGACSGTALCTVTLDQPRLVTALFIPSYLLSTTIVGSGTIHSSPAPDINCTTATCTQSYSSATVITLTASPSAGFVFNGWSGACTGVDTCLVMLNQARSVTATFIPTYPLNVTMSGSGTVHSTPAPDMNCSSATCSQSYKSGTSVTLTAIPATGFVFSGWSGACTGADICTVTIDQAKSASATFTRVSYPLTLTNHSSNNGVVHSSPTPDINCSTGICEQWYPVGTVVTLSAAPNAVSYFSTWTSACSGTEGNNCTVTMNKEQSVGAIFYGCFSMASSSCYVYILDALAKAPDGSTIKAREGILYQGQETSRSISLTLEGGYDATFTNRTGVTTISSLIVTMGTLTISDIAIQ